MLLKNAFFMLVFAGLAHSQVTLSIKFIQDSSRNTSVELILRNGEQYISLPEIAKVFGLRQRQSTDGHASELLTQTGSIRAQANNPYVLIIDPRGNSSIVQMPVSFLSWQGSLLAPLDGFLPILENSIRQKISYAHSELLVGTIPTSPYDVTGIVFEEKSNGLLIRIHCTRKISDYESWPKTIGANTWLYVTLANARADLDVIRSIKLMGVVQQILTFQSPTSVQLTFKLNREVSSTESIPVDGGYDILIAAHFSPQGEPVKQKPANHDESLQRQRDRWKLDVVVIDAGHGGEDPGTIGVMRTKEKDVTLGIALKLGKLIESNLSGVRVVYTRKTDTFVELYRRGQIANESAAKLFISIHCNSMPHKPRSASGFEIYLLRPGKSESAIRIAERENSAAKFEPGYENRYQQLTEENFILLSMAQSAYVKYSEKFASILQQEMQRHVNVSNNGIKQAGFYVLVGTAMPNVLVETAYLSNRHDEQILRSAKGQSRFAEAILDAIKRYKLEYEKSLTEGKYLGADTN